VIASTPTPAAHIPPVIAPAEVPTILRGRSPAWSSAAITPAWA
jgi:hypothetical protein